MVSRADAHARPVASAPLRAEARRAYERAAQNLARHQHADGRLAGEVVWNIMLPCQYVMLAHMLGRPLSPQRVRRTITSLHRQRNPDGGWGMHPGSGSYLFHTVLGYIALRLLGVERDDPTVREALGFIRKHGGPYTLPAWGRVWLAMLGMYPWAGMQPILPELWLLPKSAPLHPSRLYCHMRLIYLGLSFLYGKRYVCRDDPTLAAIRSELYPEGYRPEAFEAYRDQVASTDLYEPVSRSLQRVFELARRAERFVPRRLRARALRVALDHIRFEFRSTDYVCLSPVNGMLFCLALHATDPQHPELDRAFAGLEYWVWSDEDEGFRIAGARSDIWDTAFAVQALCEGPKTEVAAEVVRAACRWLPTAQIKEEIVGGARHFRSPAYGGWGFANERHPWPVSDCTAEALEALLRAEACGLADRAGRLPLSSKLAAVEFVLQRSNGDGGFGSYEARRGPMMLRRYNPAELYGNCMLEYSYTECTGTCVRGLAYAAQQLADDLPTELARRVRAAIEDGAARLEQSARPDGGWLGFWGVNLTYGTMFATAGLLAAGRSAGSRSVALGVRWLLAAQRADGGWGESPQGLRIEAPVAIAEGEASSVTQTAWALLTLLEAAPREREAIERGVRFLIERQSEGGGWPPEAASGVFFNTAVLDYRLYREVFPAWALGRYLR